MRNLIRCGLACGTDYFEMGEESFPDVAKMNTRMVDILDKIGINLQTAKKDGNYHQILHTGNRGRVTKGLFAPA